jgi:hypothetical protein
MQAYMRNYLQLMTLIKRVIMVNVIISPGSAGMLMC